MEEAAEPGTARTPRTGRAAPSETAPARGSGMSAALLLIADSRLPAGGHAHSGGAEEAVYLGAITGPEELARFLRGRLATTGLVAAALSAAACHLASAPVSAQGDPAQDGRSEVQREDPTSHRDGLALQWQDPSPRRADSASQRADSTPQREDFAFQRRDPASRRAHSAPQRADFTHSRDDPAHRRRDSASWRELDAEADARTPSPATRAASRTQGRLLVRSARRIWPSAILDGVAKALPEGAHHAIALGAVAASAGCTPREAALAAAYNAITGPATAAVRLLGLDPVTVHRLLADLAPDLDRTAADGGTARRDWAALPCHGAPALDLLAEHHVRREVRLFVS